MKVVVYLVSIFGFLSSAPSPVWYRDLGVRRNSIEVNQFYKSPLEDFLASLRKSVDFSETHRYLEKSTDKEIPKNISEKNFNGPMSSPKKNRSFLNSKQNNSDHRTNNEGTKVRQPPSSVQKVTGKFIMTKYDTLARIQNSSAHFEEKENFSNTITKNNRSSNLKNTINANYQQNNLETIRTNDYNSETSVTTDNIATVFDLDESPSNSNHANLSSLINSDSTQLDKRTDDIHEYTTVDPRGEANFEDGNDHLHTTEETTEESVDGFTETTTIAETIPDREFKVSQKIYTEKDIETDTESKEVITTIIDSGSFGTTQSSETETTVASITETTDSTEPQTPTTFDNYDRETRSEHDEGTDATTASEEKTTTDDYNSTYNNTAYTNDILTSTHFLSEDISTETENTVDATTPEFDKEIEQDQKENTLIPITQSLITESFQQTSIKNYHRTNTGQIPVIVVAETIEENADTNCFQGCENDAGKTDYGMKKSTETTTERRKILVTADSEILGRFSFNSIIFDINNSTNRIAKNVKNIPSTRETRIDDLQSTTANSSTGFEENNDLETTFATNTDILTTEAPEQVTNTISVDEDISELGVIIVADAESEESTFKTNTDTETQTSVDDLETFSTLDPVGITNSEISASELEDNPSTTTIYNTDYTDLTKNVKNSEKSDAYESTEQNWLNNNKTQINNENVEDSTRSFTDQSTEFTTENITEESTFVTTERTYSEGDPENNSTANSIRERTTTVGELEESTTKDYDSESSNELGVIVVAETDYE